MQKRKLERDILRCRCGRELKAAAVATYRSHESRYVFHRCECGLEWTEQFTDVDRSSPITGDELLAVHKVLRAFEGSLPDLLQQPEA